MSYVAVGNVFDAAARASAAKRRRTMDWREGAADTPEKAKARKKMAEMAGRRAQREAEAAAEAGAGAGEGAAGGGMTTYLMLGGAALVLLFVLKKRKT